MRTVRFLGFRLASMVLVLLLVAFLTYVIFYLIPSDPAQLSCGRPCTAENLALARGFMGFDEPWWQQFLHFLGGIFGGRTFGSGATAIHCAAPCFGYSFQQNDTVLNLIGQRMPVTFSIAIGASVLWVIFGVTTGVFAAVKRGSAFDRASMLGSMFGVSAPTYLVGGLGILLFGFVLNMLPANGYVPFTESPIGWLWHLILPWCVLAFAHAAVYIRLTRGQMLEVLNEDYIRTARAKGLPERTVIGKHALRNVLLPLVTVFGIDLGLLLGGIVITERVFSMPGLGGLLIDAVSQHDLPLLLGGTLFSASLIVTANVVVDLCYGVLDPRARLT